MKTTQLITTDAEINFRKSEELVTQLKDALSLTSVKQAISILRDTTRPRGVIPDPVPGLHPDANLAHYYHFIQGANLVLDRLEKMARRYDPREAAVEDPDEFDHIAEDPRFQKLPLPETK